MTYDIKSIKKIRKQLGLTQTGFAKEAGVSQSLVAKIESGKIDPTYSKVQKIFSALDRLSKKKEISAREIMVKNIVTTKPCDKIVELVKTMHRKGISQVPVVEGRKIIGLVTEKDILEKVGDDNIHKLKATDVMVEPPPIVSADTKISVLTSLIKYYPLLIVTRKGEIAGVIAKSDIIGRMI